MTAQLSSSDYQSGRDYSGPAYSLPAPSSSQPPPHHHTLTHHSPEFALHWFFSLQSEVRQWPAVSTSGICQSWAVQFVVEERISCLLLHSHDWTWINNGFHCFWLALWEQSTTLQAASYIISDTNPPAPPIFWHIIENVWRLDYWPLIKLTTTTSHYTTVRYPTHPHLLVGV